MGLFRRKKQAAPEEAAAAQLPEPPVTVLLHMNGDAESVGVLLSALPEYSEIALSGENAAALSLPEGKNLTFAGETGARGRYIVYADGDEKFEKEGAEALFGFLSSAEEDVVFFSEKGKVQSDPLAAVIGGQRPLPARCAVRRALAQSAEGVGEKYAQTFLPLLFAKSAAAVSYSLSLQAPKKEADADEALALVKLFNGIKPLLPAERYAFAFRYICGEFARIYAEACISGESASLRAADDALKAENMALWVALADRSSFGFVKALRKNGYALPLHLKALLKAKHIFGK